MRERICKISLFSAILACVTVMPAGAAIKTKSSGRSYSEAYQQVNAMRYQQEYMNATETPLATTASATATLPVMVSDEKLAAAILDNTAENVTMDDLDACAMVYPNGIFKWAIPESGVHKNQTSQCVAVVELRDAKTNAVLATTTLAAGDTMKCNVESFPESGMSFDLKHGRIEVPADEAPTMEDVEAVMNEEQKQNAGLKIAAGAIISGIAGNLLAPKEAGDTKLLGTSKTQLIDTAIGATAGAGIMAASSYSGKVAGDTIKSTAVNAASGMVVGNMFAGMSGGNAVLATTKCKINSIESDCIIGTCAIIDKDKPNKIEKGIKKENDKEYFYFTTKRCDEVLRCEKQTIDNLEKYVNCVGQPLSYYANMHVMTDKGSTSCSTVKSQDSYFNSTKSFNMVTGQPLEEKADSTGTYFVLNSADVSTSQPKHAYAVLDLSVKPFGYKVSDWDETLKKQADVKYYNRNSDNSVGLAIEKDTCLFKPKARDADNGALVDLSNQARAKGTLVGTAAGGALGGFAGYQGAKSEISERWLAAQREYEGSLTNFACWTGARYLSPYNGYADIPDLKKTEQK